MIAEATVLVTWFIFRATAGLNVIRYHTLLKSLTDLTDMVQENRGERGLENFGNSGE